MTYRPEGYSTVSPYLIVAGADRTIDFLQTVFGGDVLRRFSAPEGGVLHAEVRVEESVLMIADATEAWPPTGAHVHVYVADVDETHRAALSAGAVSVQEPRKQDDEDRRGGVRDPGGTTWWIATRTG